MIEVFEVRKVKLYQWDGKDETVEAFCNEIGCHQYYKTKNGINLQCFCYHCHVEPNDCVRKITFDNIDFWEVVDISKFQTKYPKKEMTIIQAKVEVEEEILNKTTEKVIRERLQYEIAKNITFCMYSKNKDFAKEFSTTIAYKSI
jgi:hypothetical protein